MLKSSNFFESKYCLGVVQKELVLSTGVSVALSALPVRYKATALLLSGNPEISPRYPQYKNTAYFFTTPLWFVIFNFSIFWVAGKARAGFSMQKSTFSPERETSRGIFSSEKIHNPRFGDFSDAGSLSLWDIR